LKLTSHSWRIEDMKKIAIIEDDIDIDMEELENEDIVS